MPIHNIHAHIFTMSNAPKDFLSLYMPELVANAVESITSTKAGEKVMEWLLNNLGGKAGKKYASFLHVGKRSGQMDVFKDLLEQYPDSAMKITALTLYMEKLGAGQSLSGYEGQLEEIIEVKKRYPDRLNIFLGVDPRWKATGQQILDQVRTYFDTRLPIDATRPAVCPFQGLKLYPSTGFYAFDERLMPTFEWAAKNGVPLMTHCSYLGGIFNNDRDYLNANLAAWNPYAKSHHPAPKQGHKLKGNILKRLINTQKEENNLNYSSYFLEPFSYREMLQYFKDKGTPLKICFAHFGGSDHMKLQNGHPSGVNPNAGDYYGVHYSMNWTQQIQALMLQFDSVYTDISYSLTDHKTHPFIFGELAKPYKDRILFGTDFFMTERVAKEKDTYAHFKAAASAIQVSTASGATISAWQLMAEHNVEKYLASTYYPCNP